MDGEKYFFRPLFMIFTFIIICIFLSIYNNLCYARNHIKEKLIIVNNQDQIVFSSDLDNRCGFAITYRHSVALTPVTDYFLIRHNSIYLDKTIYQDFGAGLPHATKNNQIMRQHDGVIEIKDYDLRLNEFTLRIGRVAEHQLILLTPDKGQSCKPEKTIKLSSIAAPGSAITFKAAKQD